LTTLLNSRVQMWDDCFNFCFSANDVHNIFFSLFLSGDEKKLILDSPARCTMSA